MIYYLQQGSRPTRAGNARKGVKMKNIPRKKLKKLAQEILINDIMLLVNKNIVDYDSFELLNNEEAEYFLDVLDRYAAILIKTLNEQGV